MMLQNPSTKYQPAPAVDLPDRQWPARTITHPPIWMSTDLRDGNQALFDPMDPARKLRLFETVVQIGIREIEVGFPSASQMDFDFCRQLIEEQRIPDDVTIEVLTPARPEFIRRTFEALAGAPRAIVHFYNATDPKWRRIVFNHSKEETKRLATEAATLIRTLAAERPETDWRFQYSPECFMGTELPFALEVCDAVTEIWEASPERPVILNLPTTVEISTPNIFADQVEWMHRHLARRDGVVISVHPHNDRGTAVASAELALLAGADRVEGCLFGNGERTGNVDLVTLALNLYTQGVHPGLDLSDINAVARVAEDCTRLPVHPRHPYVGDLVFTAFSGSHQDAIRKGFAVQQPDALWEVPYLPIDPADVGRTYDSVVRVNSQSGKGGITFLLETHYGVTLPRRMQIEFSAAVQAASDAEGGEMTAASLWSLLSQQYLEQAGPWRHVRHSLQEEHGAQGDQTRITLHLQHHGQPVALQGHGNGPIAATLDALRRHRPDWAGLRVDDYHEQALSGGADAAALALVELASGSGSTTFGAGRDVNIVAAAIRALVSAVNRLEARNGAAAQDSPSAPAARAA